MLLIRLRLEHLRPALHSYGFLASDIRSGSCFSSRTMRHCLSFFKETLTAPSNHTSRPSIHTNRTCCSSLCWLQLCFVLLCCCAALRTAICSKVLDKFKCWPGDGVTVVLQDIREVIRIYFLHTLCTDLHVGHWLVFFIIKHLYTVHHSHSVGISQNLFSAKFSFSNWSVMIVTLSVNYKHDFLLNKMTFGLWIKQ